MNTRQDPSARRTTPWPRPETNGFSANGPPDPPRSSAQSEFEPLPDLSTLERSVRHLGSDWLGLARVIIACTNALLVALRRIERRIGA
jgi:hypothetical protein